MPKVKTERHHWWPVCVSERWADADGGVHWMRPDGSITPAAPRNFGLIGNGHAIKLGATPGADTAWDECFEREFDKADSNFPRVLNWLESLEPFAASHGSTVRPVPKSAVTGELLALLIEGLVSLAIRSPMFRERAVALAEHLRGPLQERERNLLIGTNMRRVQARAVREIGGRGKVMVIYSPEREFIFGDGFYHTLTPPVPPLHWPTILAPLTPSLSVLFTIPLAYSTEPRLVTLLASQEEVKALNKAVQIYARKGIFYRSERPAIHEAFAPGQHGRFANHHNIVETLIHRIPGVPPPDPGRDLFEALLAQVDHR